LKSTSGQSVAKAPIGRTPPTGNPLGGKTPAGQSPGAKTGAGRTADAGMASSTQPDAIYRLRVPAERVKIVHEETARLEPAAPASAPAEADRELAGEMVAHDPPVDIDWDAHKIDAEIQQKPPPPPLETDYLKMAHERGLVRAPDERPIPRWTYFSGVFTFPWWLSNVARWITMAISLTISGLLVSMAIGLSSGGTAMMAGPLVIMFASAMTVVTLSFCSACFVAAVDDTADGNDEVQEATFPPLDQWFFSFFSVLGIWLMAGALGYPLIAVPGVGPFAVAISGVVLFPILFLSALESESFLLPLSPNIWKSLVRYAGQWLAFYLVSTALLAAWLFMAWALLEIVPLLLVLLGGSGLAAVMLIYARLLGRLAWRISFDRSPQETRLSTRSASREPEPGVLVRRKKARKLKLNFSDDLEQSDSCAPPESAPRKRIDFHKPR
jgi:hypothetical protein